MSDTLLDAASLVASLPPLRPAPRLESLEIGEKPDLAPDPPSAAVVGNNLVSFTSEVSPQHATDLQYALGFAELHAVQTGGIDPLKDPVGYFRYITNMLPKIGLVGQGFSFVDYHMSAKTVELDQVVLDVLKQVLSPDVIGFATSVLNALKTVQSDRGAPWSIYSSHSVGSEQSNFALGTANETNGQVAIELSAFTLAGTTQKENFLWASYSSTDVQLKYANSRFAFNDSLWNTPGVGDAIAEQMQKGSIDFIAGLPKLVTS